MTYIANLVLPTPCNNRVQTGPEPIWQRKRPFPVSRKGPLTCYFTGGAEGNRTPDLFIANEALCQLSYSPVECVESLAVAAVNQKARIG